MTFNSSYAKTLAIKLKMQTATTSSQTEQLRTATTYGGLRSEKLHSRDAVKLYDDALPFVEVHSNGGHSFLFLFFVITISREHGRKMVNSI